MLPASGTPVPQGRIYRGTSFAPHTGTLDPTGYISRGIRQSRRRAGLASTAIKIMKNGMQNGLPKPAVVAPASTVAVPHPTSGTTATLTTSNTGRISLAPQTTPPANNDPTSSANVLPYTDSSALERDSLAKSRDDALNNLTNLRNSLSENITGQERNLDNSQPQLAMGLLNRYAGRGLAFSSGYGYGVGQQNDQLANQHASLEQQLREGLAGYDAQQQQAQDAYQQGLSQLDFQDAANLAKQAGSLNIGTPAQASANTSLSDLAKQLNPPAKAVPKPVVKPVKPLGKATTKKIAAKLATTRKPAPKPVVKPAPKHAVKKAPAKKQVIASSGGGGGTPRHYAL